LAITDTKDHKINVGNNRHDPKIQTEFQQYTEPGLDINVCPIVRYQ
jgi:hypothetical protein